MRKLLLSVSLLFCIADLTGQALKSNRELKKLNNTYKTIHYDEVSRAIDELSGMTTYIDSGYFHVRNLPASSPVHQMLAYIKTQISESDSADRSKGDTSNIYIINLSDSIFYKNTYYSQNGEVLKVENIVSVPHLVNEASIYYQDEKPYKIFWAFKEEPYLMVFSFYYFKRRNISDNSWEDFKAYSPFEYQRAINLIQDYNKKMKK